jgi:hypothetical protein
MGDDQGQPLRIDPEAEDAQNWIVGFATPSLRSAATIRS